MFGMGNDDHKDDAATDAVDTGAAMAEQATPSEGEAAPEAPAEGGEPEAPAEPMA